MSWSASSYDAWFESPWGRYAFGVETTAVLSALGPVRDATILDLGCGTGRLLEHLEDRGALAIGADLDQGILDVARDHSRAPLVRADAPALPLVSGGFDAVVAVAVLEYLAEPAGAVAEMCRLVRVGGRVVIGSLNVKSPWGLAHVSRRRRPPWTKARFFTGQELQELGQGFGTVRVQGVLFAPGRLLGLNWLSPLIEAAGSLVPALGAFQVLTIEPR